MASWISGSLRISGGTWFRVRAVRLGAAVHNRLAGVYAEAGQILHTFLDLR